MSETKHTSGEWIAFRMVGEDGQPLRGAAAAEYVAKCIEAGGERDFFAVAVAGNGQPDICHTGNGPTSGVNAKLIAAAPNYHDAVDLALMTNGGPIEAADTVDGQPYVMVRRDAFDALVAAHAKADGSR